MTLPFSCRRELLALLLTLTCAATAPGQTVFNTFGPGNTYDGGGGQNITGSTNIFGYQAIANRFTVSLTGDLISIDLGITFSGTNGMVGVQIFGHDPTNNRPNTAQQLAFGFTNTTAEFGTTNNAVTTFTYGGAPVTLTAGQTYWLALTPGNAETNVFWHFNNIGAQGGISNSGDGSNYSNGFNGQLSAFRVNVIPEPSTYALGLVGAGLLVAIRRRRRAPR